MRSLVVSGMYRASGALFRTMETVAEENPLRSATSRMVTAVEAERLREDSEAAARRDLAGESFRAGFESAASMDSLNFSLVLGGHYSTMNRVSSRTWNATEKHCRVHKLSVETRLAASPAAEAGQGPSQ